MQSSASMHNTPTWGARKLTSQQNKKIIFYRLLSCPKKGVHIHQSGTHIVGTHGGQMHFTCKSFCTHRECPFLEAWWRAFLPASDKCSKQNRQYNHNQGFAMNVFLELNSECNHHLMTLLDGARMSTTALRETTEAEVAFASSRRCH